MGSWLTKQQPVQPVQPVQIVVDTFRQHELEKEIEALKKINNDLQAEIRKGREQRLSVAGGQKSIQRKSMFRMIK